MKVAVLGASPKPDRYSNQAVRLLSEKGHEVIPVNPGHQTIEGLPTKKKLSDIQSGSIDTLSMYVGPERSSPLKEEIIQLAPKRVIFNPGSENPELQVALKLCGIETIEACTLVMLRIGNF